MVYILFFDVLLGSNINKSIFRYNKKTMWGIFMSIWNKTFILCTFPLLIACPVGPDAVKTVDEEGPSDPILTAPQGGQMQSPDGVPPNMGGGMNGDMNGDQSLGMGENLPNPVPNMVNGGIAGSKGEAGDLGVKQNSQTGTPDNMGMGTEMMQGEMQGGMQGGKQGGMQGEGQMGSQDATQGTQQVDPAGGNTSGDVIPMYSKAPLFDDIIGQGESITIQLSVSADTEVERFNCEFIVAQTIGNRVAPKVLHMEKVTGDRTSIIAPKNYEEEVYVVITYDVKDDGPGNDDLLGGSKGTIKLGAEDLTLSYELSSDDSWMEELPWYTKVGAVQTPNGAGSPN